MLPGHPQLPTMPCPAAAILVDLDFGGAQSQDVKCQQAPGFARRDTAAVTPRHGWPPASGGMLRLCLWCRVGATTQRDGRAGERWGSLDSGARVRRRLVPSRRQKGQRGERLEPCVALVPGWKWNGMEGNLPIPSLAFSHPSRRAGWLVVFHRHSVITTQPCAQGTSITWETSSSSWLCLSFLFF